MYKDTKWAEEILSSQDSEGKWGYFHTLFADSKSPYTTERALKRLAAFGYTIQDPCIQKVVSYMNDCLTGNKEIPDKPEKLHNWNIFTSLILATWIRRFTKENPAANVVAEKWAAIVTHAFRNGAYCHQDYIQAYQELLGMPPKGGRLIDFAQFYTVSIINGCLDKETEGKLLEYLLNKPDGIYYTYDKCLRILPGTFESKQASWYLGGIELISEYETAKYHLPFVVCWLNENRTEYGNWDMGNGVKDGVYFPLSDDWRKKETRQQDCTYRITKLLEKLST